MILCGGVYIMGKKRRKMNKAQKRACVLPEINRPKNRKPKQRPNPLFFCEKRHFEIDSMIAKGTAIFVGEHQCVRQEIKVINFDGILINDNGENISVPLKRCIMCGKTIIQPSVMKEICENNSFSLYHFMGAHHGEEFNKVNTKIHDITPKHFLTRTSIGKLCVKDGHKLTDIKARIKVLSSNGQVNEVIIPAAHCERCDKYYILESHYQMVKRQGVIICKVVEEKFWRRDNNGISYSNLNKESVLHIMGYNVSEVIGLTSIQRHRILEMIVDEHILSRMEICNHLDWLIERNSYRDNFKYAIEKWTDDREYIANYNTKDMKIVDAGIVTRRTYKKQ